MNWRIALEPVARPFVHAWWRFARGLTLGVRAIVTDDQSRILLVKHTYLPGWHLPGGGVERGEPTGLAVVRELAEEAGVRAEAEPVLRSIHSNHVRFRGDHVLVYEVTAWSECEPDNEGEIEEIAWFSRQDLPDDTSPATRRRIAEFCEGSVPDKDW